MSTLDKNEEQDYDGDDDKKNKIMMVRTLKIYTAIDFSGNKLEGEIPMSIERASCAKLLKQCFLWTHPIIFGGPDSARVA